MPKYQNIENVINFKNKTIMKKMISLLVMVLMATTTFAQTAKEMAKDQAKLNAIHKKALNAKPTKIAKAEAKKLKKEGWSVPAGELPIEQQLTRSQLYGEELMTDDNGEVTKRYYQHTSLATSGSYNVGYAAARTNAQAELAALLETEISEAIEQSMDNAQASATTALTNDKFHERLMAVVNATLTSSIPMLTIYRRLPNDNFEVQVRLAYDKKEVAAKMKRELKNKLELEGDELLSKVVEIISEKL